MRTVLNVEDSADDVLIMRAACKNAKVSFRFEAVKNGPQAKAYLHGEGPYADREHFPLPDLVLLDLKMPRTSGFEVLNWIRAQTEFRDLPVLVYSGSLHQADVNHAQQLGANEFLIKSGGLEFLVDLAKALDETLAQTPPSLLPIQGFIARYPDNHLLPCKPWISCSFPQWQKIRRTEHRAPPPKTTQ